MKMNKPFHVNIRFFHNGSLLDSNLVTAYKGGVLTLEYDVSSSTMSVAWLRRRARELTGKKELEIWYKKPDTLGKKMVVDESDIPEILRGYDHLNFVSIYILEKEQEDRATTNVRFKKSRDASLRSSKALEPSCGTLSKEWSHVPPINLKDSPQKPTILAFDTCGRKTIINDDITILTCEPLRSLPPTPVKSQPFKNTPKTQTCSPKPLNSQPLRRSPRGKKSEVVDVGQGADVVVADDVVVHRRAKLIPRRAPLSLQKCHGKAKEVEEEVNNTEKKQKVVVEAVKKQKVKNAGKNQKVGVEEGKGSGSRVTKVKKPVKNKSAKGKKVVVEAEEISSDDGSGFQLTDDEDGLSDSDYIPEFGEDEVDDEEDVFAKIDKNRLIGEKIGEKDKEDPKIWGVDDVEVTLAEEVDNDSDELRSLRGSDDEDDGAPVFNPHTDFTKPIVLKKGLKFPHISVLRKALQLHSIENGYDYYYSHNEKRRVSTKCKFRCNCQWDNKKTKLKACTCESGVTCDFKIHARKLKEECTMQIKSLNLEHKCRLARFNSKVSSEYLAERFFDRWLENPNWRLKDVQTHVLKHLNVQVSLSKCWSARSRAKMRIYGNGKDQFARVWDYANAVRKHNPGSTAIVVCENIERPPAYFKKIYICLQGCKEGFLKGCRPILGVDGCHLKGTYPGMCLVAVGTDGNNNYYPLAWAVVEVENAQSWIWFLELLTNDLGMVEGDGLTLISNRQKGLKDALNQTVPKAEIRFGARHIWANFKQRWNGHVYKETFWKASRATTKAEFDGEMAGMKFLNEDAWKYLMDIEPKHWSRHAFLTRSKSNVNVNNICESFNSVLREVRDKPILTHMEWCRKYVMKRNYDKREELNKYKGKIMPAVNKYITWAYNASKNCKVVPSNPDLFEVEDLKSTWVVKMNERSCSCFHWDLTGIPCPHAMACILELRLDARDFVDEAYSRAKYAMSYEPSIQPMPGLSQWEKVNLPEPLPPPIRRMPGRPSLKKRRKEPGEGDDKAVKRARKPNRCGNCGQLGHTKKKCKNPPAQPKEKTKGGRPKGDSSWINEEREKKQKRKEAREHAANVLSSLATQVQQHQPSTSSTNVTSFTELLSQATNNVVFEF